MPRTALTVCVLFAVLLSGCLGGLAEPPAEQTPTPTPNSNEPAESAEGVPGVTNAALTNASALIDANAAALAQSGGELRVTRGDGDEVVTYHLTASREFSTYLLSQSYSNGEGESPQVDLWSNETERYVRMTADGETQYRVVDRERTRLALLASVEEFISGGEYTVQNESTQAGDLVLTADDYTRPTDARSSFSEVSSYDGRIAVGESGLIQNVTVEVVDDGRSITYRYDLIRTGIDRVPQPEWLDDVPEAASFHPDIEITPVSDSYLAIRHVGGDPIPANSTVRIESNGTTGSAQFSSQIDGTTHYAYFHAGDGELHLSNEEPESENVAPIQSPVSITIFTDNGVSLYSASMGWGSSSASEGSSSGSTTSD